MDKKQPNRTFEMFQEKFFSTPSRVRKLLLKMSPIAIHLSLYLLDEFSNIWSKQYGLFFIADLRKEVDYSHKLVRDGLNELSNSEIFLIYDLNEKGKFIMYNNPKNKLISLQLENGEIDVYSLVPKVSKKSKELQTCSKTNTYSKTNTLSKMKQLSTDKDVQKQSRDLFKNNHVKHASNGQYN